MAKAREKAGSDPAPKKESTWESIKRDFEALLEAYTNRGINPDDVVNVSLPSGRFLHNPAKKKVISPERWAAKQIGNATRGADNWLEGVKNPSRDPPSAALDAKDKWVDRLQAAIKAGKWEKRLKKVSHADIVAVAEKVGPEGFRRGIESREDKIKKVVGELQPMFQAVSDTIQAMDNKTDADREKRLIAARKLMLELGQKR
jgi:hypothetical protein